MVFLIIVLADYLTHIFQESVLTILRVFRDSVDKVYTGSQDSNCCLTQLSIAIIFSSFLKILIRGLGNCFCQNSGLTISRLGFFFFERLKVFFFFIRPATFLIACIYLLDTDEGLKDHFRLGFNGFIE